MPSATASVVGKGKKLTRRGDGKRRGRTSRRRWVGFLSVRIVDLVGR
jgi:hypothetical protein